MNLDTDLGPIPNTFYKNKLDMDYRPSFKIQNYIKLLENNIEEIFGDLLLEGHFLVTKPKAEFMKEKIDKLGFTKIKNLWSSKTLLREYKKNKPQTGRKSLQNTFLIKDWYPKSTKNF